MKEVTLLTVLMLFFQVVGWGADDVPSVQRKPRLPEGTSAEQVSILASQYSDARTKVQRLFEASSTDEERKQLVSRIPNPDEYAVLFLQIAEQNSNDSAAMDALLWVIENTGNAPGRTDTPYAKAKTALVRNHLTDARIGRFCLFLQSSVFDVDAIGILRQVYKTHADNGARSQAGFALAKLLLARADWSEFLNSEADELKQRTAPMRKFYGRDAIAELKHLRPDLQRKEAEAILDRLIRDEQSAATHIGRSNTTVGELAERQLFELRHLRPGKPVPKLEGEGIDGKPMKLSDYRGKVVVLCFWASWCGPCMADVPRERELVSQMKERPFALIGINGDEKRQTAQEVAERQRMTWPSFWGQGPDGPIAKTWNVDSWPTVYLIDCNGLIVKEIDLTLNLDNELIKQKVKEAEAAKK